MNTLYTYYSNNDFTISGNVMPWYKFAKQLFVGNCSTQANLVAVPKEYALDFAIFCQRNPKPCPLLGITDPGGCSIPVIAEQDSCNIYTDCPK